MKFLVAVRGQVLPELRQMGADVRTLARKNKEALPRDGEAIVDDSSARKTLDGQDKVYLLNSGSPDELSQGLIILRTFEQGEAWACCGSLHVSAEHAKMCVISS